MSNPWDDYKDVKQTASGPWDDFAPSQEKTNTPGVPTGGADFSNPSTTKVWNGRWYDDVPIIKENMEAIKNIKNPLDYLKYVKDSNMATLKSAGGMATGLADALLRPATDLAGMPETPVTNVMNNLLPQATPQQEELEQGIGNAMNSLDPGLMHMAPMAKAGEANAFHRVKATEPVKVPTPPQVHTPDAPWHDYTSQDELPFTNSIEDIAANRNAQANQADMFNNNQGGPAVPYDPTARLPTHAQDELPLTNSVQDIANQSSDQLGQQDMFGGAQNHVSTEPMSQIPEITPQVALRKAMDAEEAGKTAEVAFWKERAMELIREDRAKQNANREPIHVNGIGTAGDPGTMEGLSRSTEGITYENVPPDGVIPRDAQRLPNGEPMLRVPRGNEWVKDENGMPVRQGLPESTVAPDHINRYMRQDEGARNDLGNAIQEANGPKLGADDHFGSDGSWLTGSPEHGRAGTYSLEEQSGRKNAEQQHAGPGQYITQDRDLAGVYGGPTGRLYKVHAPFKNAFEFNTVKDWGNGIKQSGEKFYKSLVDKFGSKTEANAQLKKQGFDAITFTSPRGEKIANIFNKADLTDIGNAREAEKGFGELSLTPIDTPSPAFNDLIEPKKPRVYKNSQKGQAGIHEALAEAVVHAIHATGDLVRKTSTQLEDLAKKPLAALVGKLPEDHMARVSGIKDLVFKPKSGDDIVAAGLAEGKKITKLWPNVQSGMTLASQKVGSSILGGAAQWLQWQDKRTHLDNRLTVDPIQGKLKQIVRTDPKMYEALSKIMMREQGTRTLFSDQDLAGMLSPKAHEAYKMLRKGFDDALAKTNATRKAQGKEPIKSEDAYHASLRHGDYKQSIFDTTGKLIYHVASNTRAEALKFQNWMRNESSMGHMVDWEKSTIWNSHEVGAAHIPRDIMETYKEALKLIDPHNPITTLIEDTIRKTNEDRGMGYAGHDQRFLDKNNVSGFEGNKPWLSDRENAHAFMNAQMGYLRDSNRWNNFQEALNNLNPILKNPDLMRNQPNIMKTVVAHVNRELGLTPSVFKEAEKAVAKMLPGFGTGSLLKPVAFGRSTSGLYNFTSSLKHATYLTQLGFNPALAITVPIQSALAVAQHRVLTLEGYDHNPITTLLNTIADTSAGLARHTMSSMTGKAIDTPITPLGKKMLQYAEDNGILDKTVLDESGPLDNGGILSPIKKTLGATITAPEKLSRYSTFVGFTHHLMQSGKLTEEQAMQKAEDLTNNSITSMRRSDRPIVVDKLGVMGQMAYTYKSFLFNEYNQLSQLGQLARDKKQVSPLLMHVGTLFVLGGLLGLPGVGELDNGWEAIKNMVATAAPEEYAPLSGLGLKGSVMRDLPTWASMGPVSEITGTNIGTRSSSQVADLLNPLGNIAAPVQELAELSSIGKAAVHPTEQRGWEQAIHVNVPPLGKSMMEAYLDDYKRPNAETPDGRNPDGTMTYGKSNNVMDPKADYNRTPHDEAVRKLGMYSDEEYRTKAIRYANDKEQARVNMAYKAAVEAAVRNFMDYKAGKAGKLVVGQNYSAQALKLIPDADKFNKALIEEAISTHATPEQLDMMHAQAMTSLEKVMRASGTN